MADRSKLMNKDALDMPDVDYSAIAPGASLRVAATPKIAAFASVEVPLMLYSGPIQLPASYGSAKILVEASPELPLAKLIPRGLAPKGRSVKAVAEIELSANAESMARKLPAVMIGKSACVSLDGFDANTVAYRGSLPADASH